MAYGPERRIQIAAPSPSNIFTPAVTTIVLLMVAGYILSVLAPEKSLSVLALHAEKGQWHVWQLVTYAFFTPAGAVGGLIWNGLLVLFIGSMIEREWRARSFVMLWLVVSVACGLMWVGACALWALKNPAAGAAGCGYGIMATFGLLFGRQQVWVLLGTIQARYLVMILIAVGILATIRQPMGLIWVAGAGVAYLYVRAIWIARRGRLPSLRRKPRGRFEEID